MERSTCSTVLIRDWFTKRSLSPGRQKTETYRQAGRPIACLAPKHCLESNLGLLLKLWIRSGSSRKGCFYETHTACNIRVGVRRSILLLHNLAFQRPPEHSSSRGLADSSRAGGDHGSRRQ